MLQHLLYCLVACIFLASIMMMKQEEAFLFMTFAPFSLAHCANLNQDFLKTCPTKNYYGAPRHKRNGNKYTQSTDRVSLEFS